MNYNTSKGGVGCVHYDGATMTKAIEGKERADLIREEKRREKMVKEGGRHTAFFKGENKKAKSTRSTSPADITRNIVNRIKRGEADFLCVMPSGKELYRLQIGKDTVYVFYSVTHYITRQTERVHFLPPNFMDSKEVVDGVLTVVK